MGFDFKPKNTGGAAKGSFSIGGAGQAEDPLADVEYTDDLAVDAGNELSELQKGFKQRADAEKDRFIKATDSEYWFAVCFESRQEKEAFLKAARIGKKMMGDKYIDGQKLAKVLGIDM